ncbi:MAG TPA: NAD(P)-dependent oxidoreductase [Candidatus Limnocylindria bacterium]|nr:NAD(P)-dependent oxidoreductase [Candidatus Limnocylindria bacterium]
MSAGDRICVTGARGRLGSALLQLLPEAIPWSRPDYDLDDAQAAAALVERDRPSTVIHAAAWTDVDGCARQPELAQRRNGEAVAELAAACAARAVQLVVVSTNEVFNGDRTDGRGYRAKDSLDPRNSYGASKARGEQEARAAMPADGLWIVRTAWLYGPPGLDFPAKILRAADALPPNEALPVVEDEWGSPTYAPDLAAALVALLGRTSGGTFHLVNTGAATRLSWAQRVLERCRPGRRIRPISRQDFQRASRVPAWAVLECGPAEERGGVSMRSWQATLDEYLPSIC